MNIMIFAAGSDIGGGKTHILSLAQELSRTNNLKLISFHRSVLAGEAREMGISTIDMDNGWNVFKDLKMALAAVDAFQPEVIHCHGAKANMMGVMVKKVRNVTVMTTVHSDPRLDYMGAPMKQYTFGLINAVALRNMDFYMAISEKMAENLTLRGFDPQRIFTIYNGMDFSQAKEGPKPANEQGDIVVGIAARLTAIKDIGSVIRAFSIAYKKNPRLRLSIAGTGEDEAALRNLTKSLGLENRVTFEGWISDIKAYFSKVDINVLASLSENFPYSLLEGAYEHCPVIASRVGGIPALVSHGETGFLFEAGDVETFAGYIYQLSVDEELRRQLAENLFQRARKDFSLEHMKDEHEKVYAVIKRRRAQKKGRSGVVICGAYGRGNTGDEAILKAILTQLREIDSDLPFWVMSRNKMETRLANKVNSFYIFNVFAFLWNLRKAKIFVNGGGSLIQDVTSSRSLYFYLFTLFAAHLCGCRIIMYGCGIGPINYRVNRKIAGFVLNRTAEIITLRDSISLELLKEMDVRRPKILLAADPTVCIKKSNEAAVEAAFLSEGIATSQKKIGFCLRNWPDFKHPESVAKAAEYVYEKYGLVPVFLPIEIPKDISMGEKIGKELSIPYHICRLKHPVEDLIGMLSSMEAVVGMRLHALIFSTAGWTPIVGVSYDIKVDSFIRDIGSDACISLSELTTENLCAEIDKVMEHGRERASEIYEKLQKMEKINREAAKGLLLTERRA